MEKEWERKRGSLTILYGRRRIGKTRLLAEFIKALREKGYLVFDLEDFEKALS